jgi:putative FmdB family regulatory protein
MRTKCHRDPAVLQWVSMPTYRYRCDACGSFDLIRPMSAVVTSEPCPECGGAAGRVFGLPGVTFVDPNLRGALDASAGSADSPAVVRSVPGRSRRATPITTDPRHAKLPRP